MTKLDGTTRFLVSAPVGEGSVTAVVTLDREYLTTKGWDLSLMLFTPHHTNKGAFIPFRKEISATRVPTEREELTAFARRILQRRLNGRVR